MIKGINHIGIAVKDLEESIKIFQKLFEFNDVHTETIEDQKVKIASFKVGEVIIELTQAISDDSPIAKFINKRGEGIHHIAFESDDVNNELTRVKELGINLIDENAKPGAHEKLIAFLHPKSTNGVLMEFCQNNDTNNK